MIYRQIKKIAHLLNNQALTIVIAFVSTMIWARMFPIETFAAYKVAVALFSITNVICLIGFNESIKISAAKSQHGDINPLLIFRFIALIVGAVITFIIGYYKYQDEKMLILAIAGLSIIYPIYQWVEFWKNWLIGRGEFKALLKNNSLYQISIVLCLLLATQFHSQEMLLIIVLVLGVPSLWNIYHIIQIKKNRENDIFDKSNVIHGLKMTGVQVFQVLILVDILIVEHFLSLEAVAVFSIALIFPKQINALRKILTQYLTPGIYKAKSVDEAWMILSGKYIHVIIAFAIIGVLGFYIIPIGVPIIFSEKYLKSIFLAKYLWLIACCVSPFALLGAILISQKKIKSILLFQNVHPIIYISVLYVLLNQENTLDNVLYAKALGAILLILMYVFSFVFYLRKERVQYEN